MFEYGRSVSGLLGFRQQPLPHELKLTDVAE
jgi:hypothetical protein